MPLKPCARKGEEQGDFQVTGCSHNKEQPPCMCTCCIHTHTYIYIYMGNVISPPPPCVSWLRTTSHTFTSSPFHHSFPPYGQASSPFHHFTIPFPHMVRPVHHFTISPFLSPIWSGQFTISPFHHSFPPYGQASSPFHHFTIPFPHMVRANW